ncbi:NifB/NifX family molybdenum-iron cluster-binding protein [Ruminococcus sp. 5_1_39BFAA]|uniref:NifB/NifX family molybdenum-iron cluster-binding protein n=1 Tax=Ruminococcus sp. 5_1_39BFAA TaxID=457412 RepID=UPI003564EF9E
MPRPNKPKKVCRMPICTTYFSATQTDCLHEIILTVEEYETIRLIDYMGMTQEECAGRMEVGRATVQTLYTEARKKIARYLVEASRLRIEGGNYDICPEPPVFGIKNHNKDLKGDYIMKIAVTYENGQVFQHFGHTEKFKVYDVADGKIVSSEIIDTNGSGHGALAGFLKAHGVDTLICGGIGGGARNALAEAGIQLFPGASGDADAQVESYLTGSLNYNPDTVCNHHHGSADHDCGSHGEGHSCGSHSCGH